MQSKTQRLERLLKQDDGHWRWRWGITIGTILMTFLIATQTSLYNPLVVFVFYFPYLCLEWRQTKLKLSFNDDSMYRRYVYGDFTVQWMAFVLTIVLLATYHAKLVSAVTSIAALACIGLGCIVTSKWVDARLAVLDAEHVRPSDIRAARERQLYRSKTSA